MAQREPDKTQTAWNHFADELKRIGDKIVGATGAQGPRERAEGFRYLFRLIAAAQELEMETDRERPTVLRMFTPTRKFVADGADTLYHEAKLDEARTYKLTVRRGDDLFFSVVVYAQEEDGTNYIASHLIDNDIVFEERDGEQIAEIDLSAERPDGATNWLELKAHRPLILTRQYFPDFIPHVDRGVYRPATMHIECVDQPPAPAEYTDDDLEAGLERVVAFMDHTVDSALGISAFVALNMVSYDTADTSPTRIGADGQLIVDEAHEAYSPEELADMVDPKVVANNLPGPGIGYVGAMFKVADDEVMVIKGKDVPCRYWSCQILTRFLESGDYRYHPVSINNKQVHLEDDGSFTIYACRENPGVRNWLSTQGYRRGQIVIRTLLAETDMDPDLSVIKLRDIPKSDLL